MANARGADVCTASAKQMTPANYPGSPRAARDVLRVISYRRLELGEGLSEIDCAELERCLSRLRELNGEELLDLIMAHALIIGKRLTRP